MAKAPKKVETTTEEDESKKVLTPEEILGAFMSAKENKNKHLNDIPQIEYNVSTGSLLWDVNTNGGIPPGMHRFIGPPESGKSSAALEVCRNFLSKLDKEGLKARGLYIKSEGRLSREMRNRCGLKFVWDYTQWKDGTIFVLESNNYEFIINLLRRLLIVDEKTHYYCIMFDSMDGLILDGDVKKESGENDKVAGAPMLTKKFLQKMGNYIGAHGHICLMLGQYSTNISMETYASAQNKRPSQGGGGWAAAHYAHYVFDFVEPFNQDLIKEKPDQPPGPANKILGKRVKVRFKKSPNEKTGMEISYPIMYGVVGGPSIWTAYELFDVMKVCSALTFSGSWINIPERLSQEAAESNIVLPNKIQGENKFVNWLHVNTVARDFLANKFKRMLLSERPADEEPNDLKDEAKES